MLIPFKIEVYCHIPLKFNSFVPKNIYFARMFSAIDSYVVFTGCVHRKKFPIFEKKLMK